MNNLKNVTEQISLYRKYLSDINFIANEISDFHNWEYSCAWIPEWYAMCWEYLVGRQLLQDKKFALAPLGCQVHQFKRYNLKPTQKVITIFEDEVFDLKDHQLIPKGEKLRVYGFSVYTKEHGSWSKPPYNCVELVSDNQKDIIYITYVDHLNFFLANEEYNIEVIK